MKYNTKIIGVFKMIYSSERSAQCHFVKSAAACWLSLKHVFLAQLPKYFNHQKNFATLQFIIWNFGGLNGYFSTVTTDFQSQNIVMCTVQGKRHFLKKNPYFGKLCYCSVDWCPPYRPSWPWASTCKASSLSSLSTTSWLTQRPTWPSSTATRRKLSSLGSMTSSYTSPSHYRQLSSSKIRLDISNTH